MFTYSIKSWTQFICYKLQLLNVCFGIRRVKAMLKHVRAGLSDLKHQMGIFLFLTSFKSDEGGDLKIYPLCSQMSQ